MDEILTRTDPDTVYCRDFILYFFLLNGEQWGHDLLCRKHRLNHSDIQSMTTSKSPLKIAQVAYAAARKALPSYSNKFSPKKFTLAQLTAILVLKEFFSKDYRGISAIVSDSSDIQKA